MTRSQKSAKHIVSVNSYFRSALFCALLVSLSPAFAAETPHPAPTADNPAVAKSSSVAPASKKQASNTATLRPLPIGLDAYRFWDRWPEQRIGQRTYMRSTYDRRGGNGDASHFLYQKSDTFNVALDVEGPGILVFSRYNHWHGSPWHYVVDGVDYIVRETNTGNPVAPIAYAPIPVPRPADAIFIPQSAFPSVLNPTWSTTMGADLVWTPIPFEHSFQMAYTRTHYGTGYYIYDQFVPGIKLSRPIKSWSPSVVPDRAVIDLLSSAGMDISPKSGYKAAGKTLNLPATGASTIASLRGKATIRSLTFSIPRDQASAFENAHLRVTWDDRKEPSVDAPIALFFGAGTLYNRDNREYLVKALPVNIRFTKDRIYLACYFPMPFFKSARLELVGTGRAVNGIQSNVHYMPFDEKPNEVGYFHATYKDFPHPVLGKDIIFLDTRQTEGAEKWSGTFVGTSFIFSHNADLGTLEGDPRFFFDDSLTPQAQGTGTEEWGGGGDYWAGWNMTLPLVGHPVGAGRKNRHATNAVNDQDKIESAYRFLLADSMPFGKNAVIGLEHGGIDESTEHYETIAYWYGIPSPSLVITDQLQIGNLADERAHGYNSPEASKPYSLTSRYEWGADTVNGKMIFPATTDQGRTTKGTSEFKMRIDPNNVGVFLRRKLDYSFPDQRAEVYIAGENKANWQLAGIWYVAGSNSVVHSNPDDELGATVHEVQTSNRLFRDDEFLIPLKLTQGRQSIWVRVKFTPVNTPLYPGYPVGERAWSEMKYTAYSFIRPVWK